MNLLIRNAKKDDWDEIKYIYEAGISTGLATFETQAPSTYEQWILKAHSKCTLIAHDENKILGWCKITPISDRLAYSGVGEVSIYVHPKAQGEGVGNLLLKTLQLFGVYSGKELINRVEESGDQYQTVAIGYLCSDFEGELTSDENQAIEAQFFKLDQLPAETDPFIKNKLLELKGQLEKKNTPC